MVVMFGIDEPPEKAGLRHLPRLSREALRIAWAAGRYDVMATAALQVVGGFGIAALLLLGRSALDALLRAVQTGASLRQPAAVGAGDGRRRRHPGVRRRGAARAAADPRRAGRPLRAGPRARRDRVGRPGDVRRPRLPQPGAAHADGRQPVARHGVRPGRPAPGGHRRGRGPGGADHDRPDPGAAAAARRPAGLARGQPPGRVVLPAVLEDDPGRPAARLPRVAAREPQLGQGGAGLRPHRLPAPPPRRPLRRADRRSCAGSPTAS